MKRILLALAVVAGALLVVAVGALILALAATGVGALLASFLPFSAFEAALLALIAVIGVALVAGQIVGAILRIPPLPITADEDEDDDEDLIDDWESGEWEDDLDDRGEDEEDIIDPANFLPPTLRQQQPIRRTEFEKVGRNDPCPCGSGRKYKNCHGKTQTAN